MMRNKTQRWFAGVAGGTALAVTALVAPAQAAPAQEHADTQAMLDRYQRQAGPGAAVHAGDGAEAWTLSSGSRGVNDNGPLTASDHFRAASQTKTFTATVVLQLFDEGLVDLDAPVERYLPGVVTGNYDGTVITVRQLLNHTAGLSRDTNGAAANPDGTYELAELVRAAMDETPQSAPGGPTKYSNVGYLVLGMLIEKVTGQYVGDAITQRIIEPLGLSETSFPAPGERALADPYLPGYQGLRIGGFYFWIEATTMIELSLYSSAGAMESTLEDLARFYRALLDGELLSQDALAEMRTTVPFSPEYPDGYGLGIRSLHLSCGVVAWGHDGMSLTGHASLTMVTDDGRFASVVTNANISPQDPAALDVANAALCEGQS
ncbi:D-alanyl-D-alanine carboxypeptidase [Saccharomonospora amisosensis]|uniref:D-alanyl-D-alanine carboxypeptidase n=2 Tax=Saccharomonospora amisosensis TaxID=1128677 RepID=A0A7X5ZPN0_9PSEU|nr:serine hydrolase domain-containing protein [Saccharomonospora amisosensis]NIJ10420.1 D-alanyl-D-alanine carboxypeptidase [Saccharomonospora amisosensis]